MVGVLDSFQDAIVKALEVGPKTMKGLMEGVGLTRPTLIAHLKPLLADRLVVREQIITKARGRPKFSYRLVAKALPTSAPPASRQMTLAQVVNLPFQKLRHACRFEKGGWCRETKKGCSPDNCPLITK